MTIPTDLPAASSGWRDLIELALAEDVGNGDITNAADVAKRRAETRISGVMIGRAAMSSPWIGSARL